MPQGNEWLSYIAPFATAIGKTPEEVTEAVKALVGEPGPDAVALLSNEADTPLPELLPLFAGVATAKLRKAISAHLRKVQVTTAMGGDAKVATPSFDVLPTVPDDETWLAALKIGGELKAEKNTVIAGIRAALADRSGLFGIPDRLLELMEGQAVSLSEPVGKEFFELQELITTRNYAEIFAALKIDGRKYAAASRKRALVAKLDEHLWPALISFHGQLRAWNDSWQQSFGNPGAMAGLLTVALAGGRGGPVPPNMVQPPPTDGIRDAADTVVNEVNRVFAGFGIPVAMALAYDAQCIKKALENPALPVHVGAANRDQMLKLLNVDVTADYVRLERNITRYALGIMEFPKVTGDGELTYLATLLALGTQIPWDKLQAPARRGALNRRQTAEE